MTIFVAPGGGIGISGFFLLANSTNSILAPSFFNMDVVIVNELLLEKIDITVKNKIERSNKND